MSVALPEELELHEAAEALPIRPDGLVPLHIIRPGIGKGRGKHLYEAEMLEREAAAGRFKHWKMYLDHQDPIAKKRAAGLPRKITDLGGQIKEQWWDPQVPPDAAAGHGRGAVVGLARVNRFVRSLIEDLGPEAIGVSISATATGVRPVSRGGQQVWLVEGINPRGSVDFVTEPGAGGRVVSLVEALEESLANDGEVFEMLEGRSTEEVIELVRAERPELLASLLEAAMDAEDEKDGGDDELAELTKSYTKKFNGNKKLAARAAQRKLAAKTAEESRHGGGDVNAEELLQEALESEGGGELLEAACEPIVEKLFAKIVAPRLEALIEAALEDERDLIQAEASAVADRKVALRDMRDAAHRTINEARLPEPFKVELRGRYDLVEGKPTAALDVVDDAEGENAKTAEQKVTEALAADLKLKEEQFRASRPTTVSGQGARSEKPEKKTTTEVENKDGETTTTTTVTEAASTGSERTDHVLREAKVAVDDDLYAGIL